MLRASRFAQSEGVYEAEVLPVRGQHTRLQLNVEQISFSEEGTSQCHSWPSSKYALLWACLMAVWIMLRSIEVSDTETACRKSDEPYSCVRRMHMEEQLFAGLVTNAKEP